MTDDTARSSRRATCPVCGRPDRLLRADGRFWHHNDPARKDPQLPFGQRCAGSGQYPSQPPGAS